LGVGDQGERKMKNSNMIFRQIPVNILR